jgi:transcriptional regulator with XRE-family HTH domain
MPEGSSIGERLKTLRKRRGLTQRELATASGVSVQLIRMLEQGQRDDTRLETARKLAVALRTPTTRLLDGRDTVHADAQTVDRWEPVRRALAGQHDQLDEDPPPPEAVRESMSELRSAIAANRYAEVAQVLPPLLRDADALNGEGRAVRGQLLNMVGWLLVMTRQFDTAEHTLDLAVDGAADRLDAAAAVNTKTWSLLRQGRLAEARSLATEWADEIEPRFSRAAVGELAIWGRLLLNVNNAAVRDNRPGEAEDAIRLARAAADRIGREVVSDRSTTRTFGPVTVAQICAESYVISDQPDRTLAIAERMPKDVLHPRAASRLRHRLDVAHARALIKDPASAFQDLQSIRRTAPEWIVQQRYAWDVLGKVIERRRTLSPDMREMADAFGMEL